MQSIHYSREKIIEVLRTLEELVVSLDRIWAGAVDQTKEENDATLSDFIDRHQILRKVAEARFMLSEPFADDPESDNMDELEREMQGVDCWTSRKDEQRKDDDT